MPGCDAVHECECASCLSGVTHQEQEHHFQLNLLMSRLDEQQRRWFVAVESNRIGHGGDTRMAEITGISVVTIRRGRLELSENLAERPTDRIRVPGGGRPTIEKKIPKRRRR